MIVEVARPDDIPAIMSLERCEGFEGLVGRWSADEHSAEMAKASSRYFVVRDGGRAVGFALVQGLGDGHGKAHLRRIAVAAPGTGTGTRLTAIASTSMSMSRMTGRSAPTKRPGSRLKAGCGISTATPTAPTGTCG